MRHRTRSLDSNTEHHNLIGVCHFNIWRLFLDIWSHFILIWNLKIGQRVGMDFQRFAVEFRCLSLLPIQTFARRTLWPILRALICICFASSSSLHRYLRENTCLFFCFVDLLVRRSALCSCISSSLISSLPPFDLWTHLFRSVISIFVQIIVTHNRLNLVLIYLILSLSKDKV